MGYNKFIIKGSDTPLLDLTGDTVSEDTLLKGIIAHNKFGDEITGKVDRLSIVNGELKSYEVATDSSVNIGDFIEFVTDSMDKTFVRPAESRADGIASSSASGGQVVEVYCVKTGNG